MKKYSILEKVKRSITFVVAYPNEYGCETLDNLYAWQSNDAPNRQVFEATDKVSAQALLKNLK
jgi:hypothetical protein